MKCTGSQFCECRECEAVKNGVKPRLPPVRVDSVVGFCHWTMMDGLKQSECGYKDVGCHPTHCPKCGREITFDKPNAESEASE